MSGPSAESDATDERDQFCWDLAPHLLDTLELLGIENPDMSDGRALADTIYCLGYRVTPPEVTQP